MEQATATAGHGFGGSLKEGLAKTVRGAVLQAGDEGYEEARQIHNGMIDRRPAVIVRCAGAADVIHCVNAARDFAVPISVRGGGHGVAGFSVCDGGVMADLSGMRSVRVDPANRIARAEGGATWGDFDHETQAFGLATTGGVARPTGIAGLTLAGGHGFLMRKYGLACDNLVSADIVTADGRMLIASATENADLFWGLRGGGGNFGVVTSFEYRLHPVGPVLGGLLIYPLEQAREVLQFYDEFAGAAPDELGLLAAVATLPDGAKAVVTVLGYNGPLETGEAVLRPLRSFGKPQADQIAVMPYTALQSIVENFNPRGMRNYWKAIYLNRMDKEAIDVIVDQYADAPHPFTHSVIYTLGGAVARRTAVEDTAVAYRDSRHAFIVIGMWIDPAEDEKALAYVRRYWRAMQPFASRGVYPNYDADLTTGQINSAFDSERYERLVALKKKYDPTNLFRLNQNIQPTIQPELV